MNMNNKTIFKQYLINKLNVIVTAISFYKLLYMNIIWHIEWKTKGKNDPDLFFYVCEELVLLKYKRKTN